MSDDFLDCLCLVANRVSVWFFTDSNGAYLKAPFASAVGHLSALYSDLL